MAYAMVDRHSHRLASFVVLFDVGGRLYAPGDVSDDFGLTLASFGQSELMVFDLGIRRHEYHAPRMFAVSNKPEKVPIERCHLLQIIHVKHDMAQPHDLWHIQSSFLLHRSRELVSDWRELCK